MGYGLFADIAQGIEIARALGIGKAADPHGIAGNIDEEGIGEQEVGIAHLGQGVIGQAEGEVQAVETLVGQHGKIGRPHVAVVKPRLVVGLAGELAHHAAHRIDGALDQGLGEIEGSGRIPAHTIGQFAQAVAQAARVAAGDRELAISACDLETFGRRQSAMRRRDQAVDDKNRFGCCRAADGEACVAQGGFQRARRPLYR